MSVVLHILGELVSAVAEAHRARGDTLDLDSLREQVRPVPGVEVLVPDGALLTGLIVVVENQPVIMLCARRDPPPRRWARPEPAPWSPSGPSSLSLWDDEFHS